MAEAENRISFDEALLASHNTVTALGALATTYEQLANQTSFGNSEQVALDALRSIIIQRVDQLPTLITNPLTAPADGSRQTIVPDGANGGHVSDMMRATTFPGASVATSNMPKGLEASYSPPAVKAAPLLSAYEVGQSNGAKGANDDIGTVNNLPTKPSSPDIGAATSLRSEVIVPKPNGRSIVRIDEATIDKLNKLRGPENAQNKVTKIMIVNDKTVEVNGVRHKLRVPADGSPSTTMQVLNIILEAACAGKSVFSIMELDGIIDEGSTGRTTVWQAASRLLKSGFLERHSKSGREIIVGLPKFVAICDMREQPAETEGGPPDSFLVSHPAGGEAAREAPAS